MKLGTFTVVLGDLPLDEACHFLADNGVQMVEIGCGGFPGKAHCDAAALLADEGKRKEFLDTIHRHGLEISALSSHGNMVHPDRAIAKSFDEDLTNAILLAEKLGVPVVNTFSGCPGGSPEDRTPNWVTCPWPDDFSGILEYQWNEVLIPYWKEKVANERNQLLAQARMGDEDAIESLTLEDMDTYTTISRRIHKEDVFSLVDTYFMPYGVECDQYSILGEITECHTDTNRITDEEIIFMTLECNEIVLEVCINRYDLYGEPAHCRLSI